MVTVQSLLNLPTLTASSQGQLTTANDTASAKQAVASFSAAAPVATDSSSANSSLVVNTQNGSSSFLTQLLGQNNDIGNIALATSSARFTPAPAYDTLLEDAFIKYKPSYAGLPQPSLGSESTAVAAEQQQSDISVTTSNEFQAYNNTQLRNQSSLLPEEPSINIAG